MTNEEGSKISAKILEAHEFYEHHQDVINSSTHHIGLEELEELATPAWLAWAATQTLIE